MAKPTSTNARLKVLLENTTPAERERMSPRKKPVVKKGVDTGARKVAGLNTKVAKTGRVVTSPSKPPLKSTKAGIDTNARKVSGMKPKVVTSQRVSLTAKKPPVSTTSKAANAGRKVAKAERVLKSGASKAGNAAKAGASKAGNAAKAGASKTGAAAKVATKGLGKAAKVAGKYAAPVAAAAGAIEVGKLLASKEARDKASANFEAMGEKNTFGRAVESALDPVNTIYGAGAALADIANATPADEHQRTLDAAVDPAQRAAAAEKGAKRDALMAEAFSPEEFQKLNRDLLASDPQKWNALMNAKTVEEARSYGGDGGIPDDASFADRVEARVAAPAPEPTIKDEAPPVQDTSNLVPTDNAGALDRAPDPEVEPLSEESSAVSLFSTVHGGPFDPNSSMDRAKLAKIQSLLDKNGGTLSGMTPNQFALKIYRQG